MTPRWIAPVLACLLLLESCAVNPATGKKQLSLYGEQDEVKMGRQYDQETLQSLALYGTPELQAYVQQIGASLAAGSERPQLGWTFRLVDDPAVNAFAIPGGFIYVTRGLLTHMTSEAELASVVGHEIGHVTARHTVSQMSKQGVFGGLLQLGTILSPTVQQYGALASQSLGVLFLKFSRDDESQADGLGLRYILRAGYDPRPMVDVFTMLGNVSRLEGGGRLPDWLATHPNPDNRRQKISQEIAALHQSFEGRKVERDPFLRRLDGVAFGENPREGFFRGSSFLHPDMKFRLDLPEGWTGQNMKDGVVVQSPDRDAVLQLSLAGKPTPQAAAQEFFSRQGLQQGRVESVKQHGFETVRGDFQLAEQQQTLRGIAAFIPHEGKVFRLVGFTLSDKWSGYRTALETAIASFDRLTDPKVLAIEPAHVEIVRLERDMTLEQFNRLHPSSIDLDHLAVANQVERTALLRAGQLVKRVVGGASPG